jgi:hypothetical protein
LFPLTAKFPTNTSVLLSVNSTHVLVLSIIASDNIMKMQTL